MMGYQDFIESREEIEKLLQEGEVGYLGLCVDGDPYVVPVNYYYVNGKIIFHCGLKGKKLDYLKMNPRVCFTVAHQPGWVREHVGGNPCHVDSDSVICYGVGRLIEELQERKVAMEAYRRRYRPDAGETTLEKMENCCVVEISISEMTGRQERERKRTLWRYAFE